MIRYPDFRPPVGWNGRLNRATPQYNGLVGLYSPLSGGARDLTEYANHASFTNQAAATGLNPVTGRNFIFDGTNDAINIPDSTANSLSTMSIFAWVRFDNIASSRALIRKGSQAGTDTTWLWYWAVSQALSLFATSGGNKEKAYVWLPVVGVWYHLGFSVDSSNVYHFVNGVRYTGAGSQPVWVDDSDPLMVGEWSTFDFNGGMSDIRIYNRVFGEHEARPLYAPATRWELYQPTRPQIWWVPPAGGPQTYTKTLTAEIEPLADAPYTFPIKQTSRTLTAALTPAANTLRSAARTLTAALTPAATITKRAIRTLAAIVYPETEWDDPDPLLFPLRRTSRTLTAGLTPAANILRSAARTLTAAVTPTATLVGVKAFLRTLTASLTPAANLVKQPVKSLTAGLTPTASAVKNTARTLTAAVTPAANILRSTARTLTAALTPTATLVGVKTFLRTVTASLTPTANLVRLPVKSLTAELTPAASILRRTARTLTAGLTPVASLLSSLVSPSRRARCTILLQHANTASMDMHPATLTELAITSATLCTLEITAA